MTAIVPETPTPEAATILASDPDATAEEIAEMQSIVIRSGSPMWATRFAAAVYDADVPALQQVVVDVRDPYWAMQFAAYVPDADTDVLEQIVLGTEYNSEFYDLVR